MNTTPPLALVIGATRGLGLGLVKELRARGWEVIATARSSGDTELHALAAADPLVTVTMADMTKPESLDAVRREIPQRRLDLLFVNGGITRGNIAAAEVPADVFSEVMVSNALGPLLALAALASSVRPAGTIAVMSSSQGSISLNVNGGQDVYRASKSALNQMMRSYAARNAGDSRTLLLVNPGHVRTGLGGDRAELEVEDVVPGIISTVSRRAGQGGLEFVDWKGEAVPW